MEKEKKILERALAKAQQEGFPWQDLKVDIKNGELGFYEGYGKEHIGNNFYTLREMVTLKGIMNAIFGEVKYLPDGKIDTEKSPKKSTILLTNGEIMPTALYYMQHEKAQ